MSDASHWDSRYAVDEYLFGTQPNDWLAAVADRIPPGRVLCLGDGEGRNSVFLAERGYEVVAVDASRVGLEKGQRLAAGRGVTVTPVVADLAEYEVEPEAWSGIVSIFVHLLPDVRRRLHRQVVDGLLPGGAFVLEAYTPAHLAAGCPGGPSDDARMMTLDGLRSELAGLRFDVGRELRRDVIEGTRHSGPGEVVQVHAFKPAE